MFLNRFQCNVCVFLGSKKFCFNYEPEPNLVELWYCPHEKLFYSFFGNNRYDYVCGSIKEVLDCMIQCGANPTAHVAATKTLFDAYNLALTKGLIDLRLDDA